MRVLSDASLSLGILMQHLLPLVPPHPRLSCQSEKSIHTVRLTITSLITKISVLDRDKQLRYSESKERTITYLRVLSRTHYLLGPLSTRVCVHGLVLYVCASTDKHWIFIHDLLHKFPDFSFPLYFELLSPQASLHYGNTIMTWSKTVQRLSASSWICVRGLHFEGHL